MTKTQLFALNPLDPNSFGFTAAGANGSFCASSACQDQSIHAPPFAASTLSQCSSRAPLPCSRVAESGVV